MRRHFPEGLSYVIHYDTTTFIRQAINSKSIETLFEAGILVLIVIVVFLQNWRATLVPATTIPVTIIGAFAAMKMLGFTINLMTLFALVLSIGIVVDDAIVIVENASHYIDKGLPSQGGGHQGHGGADRTGDGHHPGADRRYSCPPPFSRASPARSSGNSPWSSPPPRSSAPSTPSP